MFHQAAPVAAAGTHVLRDMHGSGSKPEQPDSMGTDPARVCPLKRSPFSQPRPPIPAVPDRGPGHTYGCGMPAGCGVPLNPPDQPARCADCIPEEAAAAADTHLLPTAKPAADGRGPPHPAGIPYKAGTEHKPRKET